MRIRFEAVFFRRVPAAVTLAVATSAATLWVVGCVDQTLYPALTVDGGSTDFDSALDGTDTDAADAGDSQ